jgi:alpha-tubulin suppressor-like RCC1 family protein
VNDNGALGRDTKWEPPEKNEDDSDFEDDDDDTGINPRESTPAEMQLPPGLVIAQVAATDNASFVVTSDGDVYGWGTFTVSFLNMFLGIAANQCRALTVSSGFLEADTISQRWSLLQLGTRT